METTERAKKLKVQSFLDFVEENMDGSITLLELKNLWDKWENFVCEMDFQVRLGK